MLTLFSPLQSKSTKVQNSSRSKKTTKHFPVIEALESASFDVVCSKSDSILRKGKHNYETQSSDESSCHHKRDSSNLCKPSNCFVLDSSDDSTMQTYSTASYKSGSNISFLKKPLRERERERERRSVTKQRQNKPKAEKPASFSGNLKKKGQVGRSISNTRRTFSTPGLFGSNESQRSYASCDETDTTTTASGISIFNSWFSLKGSQWTEVYDMENPNKPKHPLLVKAVKQNQKLLLPSAKNMLNASKQHQRKQEEIARLRDEKSQMDAKLRALAKEADVAKVRATRTIKKFEDKKKEALVNKAIVKEKITIEKMNEAKRAADKAKQTAAKMDAAAAKARQEAQKFKVRSGHGHRHERGHGAKSRDRHVSMAEGRRSGTTRRRDSGHRDARRENQNVRKEDTRGGRADVKSSRGGSKPGKPKSHSRGRVVESNYSADDGF
ncbi:hypothetical protein TL16_g02362 [Triparma laevis f. inornata]|uniref:Uncharacterized protein n=1 Tax=Triparma laevis f. inornata TaxID=1714386 RepID=A0A9W6ZMJ5_9STRA|nr:hypothetical protein TL16_g02362 [Triparma laevis f. inornata]